MLKKALRIIRKIFKYDRLELGLSTSTLIISILIIWLNSDKTLINMDDFNQFTGSVLTVASIFLGMYGAIIGLIFSSEMRIIVNAVKELDMYENFQYRIWSAISSSSLVVMFSLGVQFLNLLLPFRVLTQYLILCILIFITVYFLTSVLNSLKFLIAAILFELGV